MERLIIILKNSDDIHFFNSMGTELITPYKIGACVFENTFNKKDGKMVLSLMSEKAYERAKHLLNRESETTGIDYSI